MKTTVCKTSRWRLLKANINNLNPLEFKAKIAANKDIVLIDVRTPEEYTVRPMPNSVNISYLGEKFWDKMEQLNPNNTFLVYCRTGRRSLRACTLMKNGGFNKEQIFNLDGGLAVWEKVFG